MELLEKLEEKGIPITLRTYAAAGGMDIEDYAKELNEDYNYRKKFSEYAKKDQALAGSGEEEYQDTEYEEASLLIKPKSILHRDFSKYREEAYTTSPTGKKHHIINQRKHINKMHGIIAKAMTQLKDKNVYNTSVKIAKAKKLL